MDLFSNFCNICYKIDNENLKDISEENTKHLNDTLINFVGHAEIIKHNVIYLCHLCCEELTRFDKFKEMCFGNLIQLRQRYFNIKSKLELEDASVVKNALEKFVQEEVRRSSANLNKDDPVLNEQVIKPKRNESESDGDCSDVPVMHSVVECDEFGLTFTNEDDVKNEMVNRSEDTKTEKFERKSGDEFDGSDNNGIETDISQIEFMNEEFDLKNDIESCDSEHFILKHFENESSDHSDLDVKIPVLKNIEGNIHAGNESTKTELHVKQEQSSQGLELQTTEDEFGDVSNVAFQIANVRTIVNTEDCGQQNITREAGKVGKKFRSRRNSKLTAATIDAQPNRPHVREYRNRRCTKTLQSDAHTCTVCNKTFTYSRSLVAHERIHTGDRPYKCNVCNKTFADPSVLIRHDRIHSGDRPYKCTVCNMTFTQSYSLIRHKRKHSGDRPYKCNVCNKTFADRSVLIRHDRIHSGDRPYKCTVCNKTFTQSSSLTGHKRIHTGAMPYKCTVCNRTFKHSGTLAAHERIHSGDRLYQCPVCNKTFTYSNNLTVHERVHSGDRPYKCTVCNKGFTQLGNLTTHKRVHKR